MLKSVRYLVTGCKKHVGNHYREVLGGDELFYYFRTCVCRVNHERKLCFISDGGHKTSSTKRTINSYIEYFQSKDYKIFDLRGSNYNKHIYLDNSFDFGQYIYYLNKEGKL